MQHLAEELARQHSAIERLNQQQREQQVQERELRRAIADSGGDRIERLALDIAAKEAEKQRRLAKSTRYDALRQSLGLLAMHGAEDFLAQRQLCAPLREAAAEREAALQNELNELGVAFAQGRKEDAELQAELRSLRSRRSNIEAQQVARARCAVPGPASARGRDALCRGTDPGARRRTRLGRRGRAPAARLRPVAAGAG